MFEGRFSPEHLIWKYAWYHMESDDYFTIADDLINEWEKLEYDDGNISIFFKNEFEIRLASILAYDDLLPAEARKAFSMLPLVCLFELRSKKITLEALQMQPFKKGRPKTRSFDRLQAVGEHLRDHPEASKKETYEMVAKQFNVSPDTIRREFERRRKKGKKKYNIPVSNS